MFITKHLKHKIDSDSKHILIRTFGYEATKIERNMIDENLKATDQMRWIQRMQNIANQAREIVEKEVIFR